MAVITLSGNDTIVINGRVFLDFADGDVCTLEFSDDLTNMKVGKNGNTMYSFKESGKACDVGLKLVRAGKDDRFLNNLLSEMKRDFAEFTLLTGEFIKRAGDGKGGVTRDIYSMTGGVFAKPPGAKSNTDGDTDQSTIAYALKFSNAPRVLG